MRLIDADALKEKIAQHVYPLYDDFNSTGYGMFWTGGIERMIDETPTVDVEGGNVMEKSLAQTMREMADTDWVRYSGRVDVDKDLWLKIADIMDTQDELVKAKLPEKPKLEGWQRRLILEHKHLKKRLKTLNKVIAHFFNGDLYFPADIDLMIRQKYAMMDYLECLEIRAKDAGLKLEADDER